MVWVDRVCWICALARYAIRQDAEQKRRSDSFSNTVKCLQFDNVYLYAGFVHMARSMNPGEAKAVADARKRKTGGRNGGRPKLPSRCPKCGTLCDGRRIANVHCVK